MKIEVAPSTVDGCVRIEMYYAKPYEFDMRIEPDGLYAIGEDDRLYGVELHGEEYLFVETYKEGKFYLYAKDNIHLERLVRDHNITFVGETKNNI